MPSCRKSPIGGVGTSRPARVLMTLTDSRSAACVCASPALLSGWRRREVLVTIAGHARVVHANPITTIWGRGPGHGARAVAAPERTSSRGRRSSRLTCSAGCRACQSRGETLGRFRFLADVHAEVHESPMHAIRVVDGGGASDTSAFRSPANLTQSSHRGFVRIPRQDGENRRSSASAPPGSDGRDRSTYVRWTLGALRHPQVVVGWRICSGPATAGLARNRRQTHTAGDVLGQGVAGRICATEHPRPGPGKHECRGQTLRQTSDTTPSVVTGKMKGRGALVEGGATHARPPPRGH